MILLHFLRCLLLHGITETRTGYRCLSHCHPPRKYDRSKQSKLPLDSYVRMGDEALPLDADGCVTGDIDQRVALPPVE